MLAPGWVTATTAPHPKLCIEEACLLINAQVFALGKLQVRRKLTPKEIRLLRLSWIMRFDLENGAADQFNLIEHHHGKGPKAFWSFQRGYLEQLLTNPAIRYRCDECSSASRR